MADGSAINVRGMMWFGLFPIPPNVELDAVQREGLAYRAWRQVGVGGSAFRDLGI